MTIEENYQSERPEIHGFPLPPPYGSLDARLNALKMLFRGGVSQLTSEEIDEANKVRSYWREWIENNEQSFSQEP